MTEQQVLKEAYRLIESGWTQNALARNSENKRVGYNSESATCFCLMGALYTAAKDDISLVVRSRDRLNLEDYFPHGYWNNSTTAKYAKVMMFNDDPKTKKEDVLSLVRSAYDSH